MAGPIHTVNDVPVYAGTSDLPLEDQETGNLAVTVQPPTFWIWFTPEGWGAVTSTTTAELAARVTTLEGKLRCIVDCLTDA